MGYQDILDQSYIDSFYHPREAIDPPVININTLIYFIKYN